jgi:hypothetical protein
VVQLCKRCRLTGHIYLERISQKSVLAFARLLGPLVAYCGTYTIDEPNATVTYKVDHGASPLANVTTRTQKITFKGDTMVMTGSEVQTPEGKMTP